jgi:hypothetical protein
LRRCGRTEITCLLAAWCKYTLPASLTGAQRLSTVWHAACACCCAYLSAACCRYRRCCCRLPIQQVPQAQQLLPQHVQLRAASGQQPAARATTTAPAAERCTLVEQQPQSRAQRKVCRLAGSSLQESNCFKLQVAAPPMVRRQLQTCTTCHARQVKAH